ncbi:MAG TPA: Uma2 family endonuclease [Thermoanaerobaculia bacterium]|nr:Uma2 family endonuclease [Thermoanaerobaculia bacterium]
MAAGPTPRHIFEEYLRLERQTEDRHEFHDGLIVPILAATRAHSQIVANVTTSLRTRFRGTPCRVYDQGLRVWVPAQRRAFYPDVVALCGEHSFLDAQRDTLLNPALLIEVLSDSTQDFDHGAKFYSYRSIPSFSEYLLISQHERFVERYLKDPERPAQWLFQEFRADTELIELQSVPHTLRFDEIYEDVELTGA